MTTPLRKTIEVFLRRDLNPYHGQVIESLLQEIEEAFCEKHPRPDTLDEGRLPLEVCLFILNQVEEKIKKVGALKELFSKFEQAHSEALHESARRTVTLDFAKALGATPKELLQDDRAFSRWFGFQAVADRCRAHISHIESEAYFLLQRLQALFSSLHPQDLTALHETFCQHLGPYLAASYTGNYNVQEAFLQTLASFLEVYRFLNLPVPDLNLRQENLLKLTRETRHVWVQAHAFHLMALCSPQLFTNEVVKRLGTPSSGDDFFVRKKLLDLVVRIPQIPLQLRLQLLQNATRDPSVHVRQGLIKNLRNLEARPFMDILEVLALNDPSPQVRACALYETRDLLLHPAFKEVLLNLFKKSFERETDPFVLRAALRALEEGFESDDSAPTHTVWAEDAIALILSLKEKTPLSKVKRWATQTIEILRCRSDPALWTLKEKLGTALQSLEIGGRFKIPKPWLHGLDMATLGRVMALISLHDFEYQIYSSFGRFYVEKGVRVRFRLWRGLHEILLPLTEKRQNFKHTQGRVYDAHHIVPSNLLYEVSPTQVPGEPVYLPEEAGWRPYIPLPDLYFLALDSGKTVHLYTPDGITRVKAKGFFLQRLYARMKLTWNFERLARLRNWNEDSAMPASTYLEALLKIGIETTFVPYVSKVEEKIDPGIQRFFPAFLVFPWQEWENFLERVFFSPYVNTFTHLLIFTAALLILFIGEKIYHFRKIKRARKKIPLVFGGSGSRGKSSTARLKGALFNSMGYKVFIKTTGSESKILLAGRFQKIRDFLLFRPFGKTTIWEQHKSTLLAQDYNADVLIWECMALKPSYIEVLQDWMKDNLSFISNTYPDHEDIQGPSGYNVAQSLCNFIPKRASLITAEEPMLPLLRQVSSQKKSKIIPVDWLEIGLIPQEILDRFGYFEHPANLALVLRLATKMGVDRDYAMKEIADNVIPDIGALKCFSKIDRHGKGLEFINGMAANEKFGCLSNWQRVGLDKVTPAKDPHIWVSCIVNNRHDRVARSKVFSQILVRDLAADRYFLVGSNIEGMYRYIEESLDAYLAEFPWDHGREENLKNLEALARKFRLCAFPEILENRLKVMLESHPRTPETLEDLGEDANAREIRRFHSQNLEDYTTYLTLKEQVSQGNIEASAVTKTLRELFMKKFSMGREKKFDADAFIRQLMDETPPGMLNRAIGIQNIKGPGLQMVHHGRIWEECLSAGKKLLSPDPKEVFQGVRHLLAMPHINDISRDFLNTVLDRVQMPSLEEEFSKLRTRLERESVSSKNQMLAKKTFFKSFVGGILDMSFIKRDKKVTQHIYDDLLAHRITPRRGAQLLEKISALYEE